MLSKSLHRKRNAVGVVEHSARQNNGFSTDDGRALTNKDGKEVQKGSSPSSQESVGGYLMKQVIGEESAA